jgi:hypothetical protein
MRSWPRFAIPPSSCAPSPSHNIHERFYCNRRFESINQDNPVNTLVRHQSDSARPRRRESDAPGCMFRSRAGRARPSWPQRTVSSMPRSLGAPRGRHCRLTDSAASTKTKTLGAHRLAPVRKHDAPSSSRRAPHYSSRRGPRMASWWFRHEPS